MLNLSRNQLTGPIPREFGRMAALTRLDLSGNRLTGSIPSELGGMTSLAGMDLSRNNLTGSIPPELGSLTALKDLSLTWNHLTGAFPRELCGLEALEGICVAEGNDIGGAPPLMYDRASLERWKQAHKNGSGRRRSPWIGTAVECLASTWHFLVPVLDDITDALLLWETYNGNAPLLWWICLGAMVIADMDRLYVLLFIVTYAVFTILLVLFDLLSCLCCNRCPSIINGDVDLSRRSMELFLSFMTCGQSPNGEQSACWMMLDAVSWVLLGSRARSTELMSSLGLAGDISTRVAVDSGLGLQAIDVLVRYHPFRYVGGLVFSCPYGHLIPGQRSGGASRRAEVMVRAVGETLLVDPLFLILGIVTSDFDDFYSLAVASTLFSVLELVIELQYYVACAMEFMEEPSPKIVITDIPQRVRSSSITLTEAIDEEEDH